MPKHRKKSAAEKLLTRKGATLAQRGEAARALGGKRAIASIARTLTEGPVTAPKVDVGTTVSRIRKRREAEGEIIKRKKSPGFTLDVREPPPQAGTAKLSQKVLADQKDSTEHHRGKPSIP